MPLPQINDGEGNDLTAVLRDLNRAKAAFQLRTIATVIGFQPRDNAPGNDSKLLNTSSHEDQDV